MTNWPPVTMLGIRAWRFLLLGAMASGAVACTDSSWSEGRVGQKRAGLIHGTDSRKNYYEVSTQEKAWMRATAMVMSDASRAFVVPGPGATQYIRTQSLSSPLAGALCEGEPFRDEVQTIGVKPATAFLIDEGIMLAALHSRPCARADDGTSLRTLVFDYKITSGDQVADAQSYTAVTKKYYCDQVLHEDKARDFTIFSITDGEELAAEGRDPIPITELSSGLQETTPLRTVGHFSGMATKLSAGVAKFIFANNIWTTLDAIGGSSGGPVFDNADRLVGLVVNGPVRNNVGVPVTTPAIASKTLTKAKSGLYWDSANECFVWDTCSESTGCDPDTLRGSSPPFTQVTHIDHVARAYEAIRNGQPVVSGPILIPYADTDGDCNPDEIVIKEDAQGNWALSYSLSGGSSPPSNSTGTAVREAFPFDAVWGNFTGDIGSGGCPKEDLALVASGYGIGFRATASGQFQALFPNLYTGNAELHPVASFLRGGYSLDSDADDILGAELLLSDGRVLSFSGGTNGLVPNSGTRFNPTPMSGLPTARSDDGRFLAISGAGFATVNEPAMRIQVVTESSAPPIIGIFDGNHGDMYDNDLEGSIETCYRVWADPCADLGQRECLVGTLAGDSPDDPVGQPLAVTTGAEMPDNDWFQLSISESEEPDVNGWYGYRLEVFFVEDGGCTADADIDNAFGATGGWNAFKVRAAGDVRLNFGQLSFIGFDHESEWGLEGAIVADDTDYDGTFDFVMDVGRAGGEMHLIESDADYLADSTPGVAWGANELINYRVLNEAGAQATMHEVLGQEGGVPVLSPTPETTVSGPSGNFDGSTTDERDVEERLIQNLQDFARDDNGDGASLITWRWSNVFVQNNVHIWAPTASPVTYQVAGARLPRPVLSTTQPPEAWIQITSLEDFLPLTLGTADAWGRPLGYSVAVTSAQQAVDILQADHSPRDRVLRELLAMELARVEATAQGQRLDSAMVYGTRTSLRTLSRRGRDAVRDPLTLGDDPEVLALLTAVNRGDVTYFRPGVPYPALPGEDDDGDGIVNIRDNCPPIKNPSQLDADGDLVGDACAVEPLLQCVMRRSWGDHTAYLTYRNPLEFRVLPIGRRNHFEGSEPDLGQPDTFIGSTPERFTVGLPHGISRRWNLDGSVLDISVQSVNCSGAELAEVPYADRVALLATQHLLIGDRTSVTSDASGGGQIVSGHHLHVGAHTRVGDIWAGGNVVLGQHATIDGSVRAGGRLLLGPGAEVLDGSIDRTYVPDHNIDWTVNIPDSPKRVWAKHGTTVRLEPGAYSEVTVLRNAKVILSAGVYYFQSMNLAPGSHVWVDDSDGGVAAYVARHLHSNGEIGHIDGGFPNLLIGFLGRGSAALLGSTSATVIAPNAVLKLGGGYGSSSVFQGQFFARTVVVDRRVVVQYQPAKPGAFPFLDPSP